MIEPNKREDVTLKVENEILYQLDSLDDLIFIPTKNVYWLECSKDYQLYCKHLIACNQKPKTLDMWQSICEENISYCGLILNGEMVARAAVERYSPTKWETADVRVVHNERNKGYAKQVVYFVTKYILENNRLATCRTLDSNVAMKNVIHSIGFQETKN